MRVESIGTLVASGLIAGESLTGVVLAGLVLVSERFTSIGGALGPARDGLGGRAGRRVARPRPARGARLALVRVPLRDAARGGAPDAGRRSARARPREPACSPPSPPCLACWRSSSPRWLLCDRAAPWDARGAGDGVPSPCRRRRVLRRASRPGGGPTRARPSSPRALARLQGPEGFARTLGTVLRDGRAFFRAGGVAVPVREAATRPGLAVGGPGRRGRRARRPRRSSSGPAAAEDWLFEAGVETWEAERAGPGVALPRARRGRPASRGRDPRPARSRSRSWPGASAPGG